MSVNGIIVTLLPWNLMSFWNWSAPCSNMIPACPYVVLLERKHTVFCEVRNELLYIKSKIFIFCKLWVTTKICYFQDSLFITICFSQVDRFHILRKLQNNWEVICKIKVYKNKWYLSWHEVFSGVSPSIN